MRLAAFQPRSLSGGIHRGSRDLSAASSDAGARR
jgi:hypothetical protein